MALRQEMKHNTDSTSIIQALIPEILPKDIHIKRRLDDGSSSVVYLGNYHNEQVVIKRYRINFEDLDNQNMWKELAILRASFPSRYVIAPVGYCLKPPQIVMEYMENGALDDHLSKKAPLTSTQKITIANDIALGILRLLEVGVVHRDIKTANILLTNDLHAKICDFDLSWKRNSEEQLECVGTLKYLAPEYYLNKDLKTLSLAAADVFSFGIVLLELFATQKVFHEYTRFCRKITKTHKDETYVQERSTYLEEIIHNHLEDCPERMKTIIVACLKENPEERPSMKEIQIKLNQLLKPSLLSSIGKFFSTSKDKQDQKAEYSSKYAVK